MAAADASPVLAAGARARVAAADLAGRTRADKDRGLAAMADLVEARAASLLDANRRDVGRAESAGTAPALVDRLRLDESRVAAMAAGLRDVARLADPVGEVVRGATLANGLELRQLRVPLGVVGIIYEARPNVTADAAGLCLKSGNAVLLRGSASARESNAAIVAILRAAVESVGLPADSLQLVPGEGHDAVKELMRARGLVDVLVPRGGAELIRSVVAESMVPVIETGMGNCHLYVDADADVDTAVAVLLDAKTSRPSVCNAVETLLVHVDVAEQFLGVALPALEQAAVTVHADSRVRAFDAGLPPASTADFDAEYLSLDLAAAVVDSLDDAVAHIRRHGSGHTEAIVTGSHRAARRFAAAVDAAAVVVNASTRFTDGGEFGFGAELGISTQKLHARGPLGLPELTTTKYVLTGDGHVRG